MTYRNIPTLFSVLVVLLLCCTGSAVATTWFHTFQVSWITESPDGVERQVIGINGRFPGPTITATVGDTLVVNVTNVDIVNGTTIHWHGLYQRGTPFMDGTAWVTQCPIAPGTSFVYTFTLNQTGTYWYHGHTLTNYVDGLYGALVIRDKNETYADEYTDEMVLLVGDWHHQRGADLLATFMSANNPSGAEPMPNSILFNGMGQADCSNWNPPLLTVDSSDDEIFASRDHQITNCTEKAPATLSVVTGRTYRIRIINTSAFTRLLISIDSHNMTIIEADGTPTEKHTVDVLSIDVGMRYSVLIHANQASGRYLVQAQADSNMGFALSGAAVLQYMGVSGNAQTTSPSPISGSNVLEPADLRPYYPQPAPGPVIQSIVLNMDFNETGGNQNMAYINNSTFTPPKTPVLYTAYQNEASDVSNVYTIDAGGVVEIVLNNRDNRDHPFYLHGHKVAVLGIGNPNDGDYNPNSSSQVLNMDDPLWRDVVTVHKKSYIVLRIIADNPGTWMMRCHIEWHMDSGLAIILNELPSAQPYSYTLPTSEDGSSVCVSPVAPPNMLDPETYGGVYLGAATTISTHFVLIFGFALATLLFV
jgi:iron transport multicopper oxidase